MKKDRKKLLTSILAGILAFVLVFGLVSAVIPVLVSAKSSSQIKAEIDELKDEKKELQEKLNELQSQLSSNMESMEEVVEQKNLIDQEIFLLYGQVANINTQIIVYGDLIADKQEELDAAEDRLLKLQEQNKLRIRAMEKNSASSYWAVIFQADSFLDMLDRLNIIFKINEADQKLIQELDAAAKEVAQAKEELQEQKAELEATKVELEESQKVLEEKRAEADELLAQLVATGAEYEALVEAAEKDKANLNSEINKLQNAYDIAKYQEYLATLPPAEPPTSSTGGTVGTGNITAGIKWVLPCSYTRVSSPFGWRIHPVYGDRRFHYGIDLSASSGTPIVAVRDGTVKVATYSSSAGYYVNVDHGDGFMSRYLHMTHYIVSPGQKVSAGQVIGYVGSTGTSTGPHLHFGLYYNGAAVNPADYIKF